MSLRDGSAKMSKSDASDMARINLADDADAIMRKVKKARTDPEPLPSEQAGLEGRAEAANLVAIYAAVAETTPEAVLAEFGGRGFGAFKPALSTLLAEALAPIAERFRALKDDAPAIDAVLEAGAARAAEAAAPTLTSAYRALGLQR